MKETPNWQKKKVLEEWGKWILKEYLFYLSPTDLLRGIDTALLPFTSNFSVNQIVHIIYIIEINCLNIPKWSKFEFCESKKKKKKIKKTKKKKILVFWH